MNVILHNSCGLDIHKNSIVACILKTSSFSRTPRDKDGVEKEIRVFDTFPSGLNQLTNWIESHSCKHVAMESTGVYWHAVYEALEDMYEGTIELLLCNARHMKNVPGKKTDIKDAEWIADLLRSGLLKGSFIPPKDSRKLRQLTRYRKCVVQDISTQKNRIEKTLQMAGFKLSTFLSDVFGVSGRNLINVMIEKGYLSPADVEIEAKYLSAAKRNEIKKAINGKLDVHQRNFLSLQIKHLDEHYAHLNSIEKSINELAETFETEIKLLDSIPGIAKTSATAIIAEVGVNMHKFPTAEHLCSWAGLSPGNNESAGKKKRLESRMETHI